MKLVSNVSFEFTTCHRPNVCGVCDVRLCATGEKGRGMPSMGKKKSIYDDPAPFASGGITLGTVVHSPRSRSFALDLKKRRLKKEVT